jgi:hypothetical protein
VSEDDNFTTVQIGAEKISIRGKARFRSEDGTEARITSAVGPSCYRVVVNLSSNSP